MTRMISVALVGAVFVAFVAPFGCSSSSSGNGGSGGVVCCQASGGGGLTECGCQPPGTVSAGGFTSTLTVSGSSCTFTDSYGDASTTATGSVVSSCPD
jgi:hypothetical protein